MKKLMVVLVLMLFFLSCKKEEEVPTEDYNISGKVVDALSGEPIQGVVLGVASTTSSMVLDKDTTDAVGAYDLHYTLKIDGVEKARLSVLHGSVHCLGMNGYDMNVVNTNLQEGGYYIIDCHAPAYYKFVLHSGDVSGITVGVKTETSTVYSGPVGAIPYQIFETCNNTETFQITYSEYIEWIYNGSTFGTYVIVGWDTLTLDLVYGDTIIAVLP